MLTHAHEDHVGALPFVLKHFDVPIYGTKLTLGLLANKLKEHDLEDSAEIHEITAGAPWEIAPFTHRRHPGYPQFDGLPGAWRSRRRSAR